MIVIAIQRSPQTGLSTAHYGCGNLLYRLLAGVDDNHPGEIKWNIRPIDRVNITDYNNDVFANRPRGADFEKCVVAGGSGQTRHYEHDSIGFLKPTP